MAFDDDSRQAFPETRWSLIRRTRGVTNDSRKALETVCRNYWRPLYAFARRSGKSPQEAEDLTQDFLIHLLGKEAFQKIEDDSGRLRTFLLSAFKNFAIDQFRRSQAAKRGGGTGSIPLDTVSLEYDLKSVVKETTPAEVFEKQWALDLLDEAMATLKFEYESSGKLQIFEALHPILYGGATMTYQQLAAQLGMREGAIKVAVHRLRQRFRLCLEQQIRETVDHEKEVPQEVAFIKAVLSRP